MPCSQTQQVCIVTPVGNFNTMQSIPTSLILKRVALVVCYVGHNPQTLLNGKFP